MQSNFRAMQPTGHYKINLSLHLHAKIGLSNASEIHYAHPLNTTCIEIQCVAYNSTRERKIRTIGLQAEC